MRRKLSTARGLSPSKRGFESATKQIIRGLGGTIHRVKGYTRKDGTKVRGYDRVYLPPDKRAPRLLSYDLSVSYRDAKGKKQSANLSGVGVPPVADMRRKLPKSKRGLRGAALIAAYLESQLMRHTFGALDKAFGRDYKPKQGKETARNWKKRLRERKRKEVQIGIDVYSEAEGGSRGPKKAAKPRKRYAKRKPQARTAGRA